VNYTEYLPLRLRSVSARLGVSSIEPICSRLAAYVPAQYMAVPQVEKIKNSVGDTFLRCQ
jgi:hypothetical protein